MVEARLSGAEDAIKDRGLLKESWLRTRIYTCSQEVRENKTTALTSSKGRC
jgi:hypothetical protein